MSDQLRAQARLAKLPRPDSRDSLSGAAWEREREQVRRVLVALAELADDDGYCTQSLAQIGSRADTNIPFINQMSRKKLIAAVALLEELGLVIVDRTSGAFQANGYRLVLQPIAAEVPRES